MEKNLTEGRIQENQRSDSSKTHLSSITEAWANEETFSDESNVSIPSQDAIEDARDWVENGSKL